MIPPRIVEIIFNWNTLFYAPILVAYFYTRWIKMSTLNTILLSILVYALFCMWLESQIPCSVWAAHPEKCTSDRIMPGSSR